MKVLLILIILFVWESILPMQVKTIEIGNKKFGIIGSNQKNIENFKGENFEEFNLEVSEFFLTVKLPDYEHGEELNITDITEKEYSSGFFGVLEKFKDLFFHSNLRFAIGIEPPDEFNTQQSIRKVGYEGDMGIKKGVLFNNIGRNNIRSKLKPYYQRKIDVEIDESQSTMLYLYAVAIETDQRKFSSVGYEEKLVGVQQITSIEINLYDDIEISLEIVFNGSRWEMSYTEQ
jgi:hypothetical protein